MSRWGNPPEADDYPYDHSNYHNSNQLQPPISSFRHGHPREYGQPEYYSDDEDSIIEADLQEYMAKSKAAEGDRESNIREGAVAGTWGNNRTKGDGGWGSHHDSGFTNTSGRGGGRNQSYAAGGIPVGGPRDNTATGIAPGTGTRATVETKTSQSMSVGPSTQAGGTIPANSGWSFPSIQPGSSATPSSPIAGGGRSLPQPPHSGSGSSERKHHTGRRSLPQFMPPSVAIPVAAAAAAGGRGPASGRSSSKERYREARRELEQQPPPSNTTVQYQTRRRPSPLSSQEQRGTNKGGGRRERERDERGRNLDDYDDGYNPHDYDQPHNYPLQQPKPRRFTYDAGTIGFPPSNSNPNSNPSSNLYPTVSSTNSHSSPFADPTNPFSPPHSAGSTPPPPPGARPSYHHQTHNPRHSLPNLMVPVPNGQDLLTRPGTATSISGGSAATTSDRSRSRERPNKKDNSKKDSNSPRSPDERSRSRSPHGQSQPQHHSPRPNKSPAGVPNTSPNSYSPIRSPVLAPQFQTYHLGAEGRGNDDYDYDNLPNPDAFPSWHSAPPPKLERIEDWRRSGGGGGGGGGDDEMMMDRNSVNLDRRYNNNNKGGFVGSGEIRSDGYGRNGYNERRWSRDPYAQYEPRISKGNLKAEAAISSVGFKTGVGFADGTKGDKGIPGGTLSSSSTPNKHQVKKLKALQKEFGVPNSEEDVVATTSASHSTPLPAYPGLGGGGEDGKSRGSSFPLLLKGEKKSKSKRDIPDDLLPGGTLEIDGKVITDSSGKSKSNSKSSIDLPIPIPPEKVMKRELERRSGFDKRGRPVPGFGVDSEIVVGVWGRRLRRGMRWLQVVLEGGAVVGTIGTAFLSKPKDDPPPRGTIPLYLLYGLTFISLLITLFLFVIRPYCTSRGKLSSANPNSAASNFPGAGMVIPVMGGGYGKLGGEGGGGGGGFCSKVCCCCGGGDGDMGPPPPGMEGMGKKKGKKNKGGGGNGVNVNLIVDPKMFGQQSMGGRMMPGGWNDGGGGGGEMKSEVDKEREKLEREKTEWEKEKRRKKRKEKKRERRRRKKERRRRDRERRRGRRGRGGYDDPFSDEDEYFNSDSELSDDLSSDSSSTSSLSSNSSTKMPDNEDDDPNSSFNSRKPQVNPITVETRWREGRKRVKLETWWDAILMIAWGAESAFALVGGKKCVPGTFEGWCNLYNVALACAIMLFLSILASFVFGVMDLKRTSRLPMSNMV